MKNVDMILNYINNKVTQEYILSCINNGDVYGVNASEIEENLNIVRNNASTILNELWKTSKLIKINISNKHINKHINKFNNKYKN